MLSELNEPPVTKVVERESNLGVLLVLLLVGRELADGGVKVTAGSEVFGDYPNGLSEVRIEVGAERSDFHIEFVVQWDEHGPNPAHYEDQDEPVGLTKTYELALIRDQAGPHEPCLSDRKTRRLGIESLGLFVEPYDDREAMRDPCGVALRAYRRIRRHVDDDFAA
jgi:hypothetical protein